MIRAHPRRAFVTHGCLVCTALALGLVGVRSSAQEPPQTAAADQETAAVYSADELDSLVAPVALYSDALLAQVLVASTYPLEVVQLQQWMARNADLEDDALIEAVAEQPWDPAIQSMAAVPDAVERLANDIQWTTELGNAFLAQQADVMDAVQRMRRKAQGNGALETNEQQKVETVVVEQKQVIVVESASPEVIYVPSYSPTVVYGPPVYPYPPVYYPPYPAGAAFVSFSVGFAWGAAVGGSCCGIGWGHNDVNINIDNNYNRNNIQNSGNRADTWQHDPQHRGGAPYADRATADRYGGAARSDSAASRQASGASQRGGAQASGQANRSASPSATGRTAPSASQRSAPSASERSAAGAGTPGKVPSSSSFTGTGASAGGDRVGNRNIPSSGSMPSGAFGGGSYSGFSGSSARAASARGASSMGGARGGGRRR